ncbi:hypothetical protein CR513_24265, partial [Mucuna pruriens]
MHVGLNLVLQGIIYTRCAVMSIHECSSGDAIQIHDLGSSMGNTATSDDKSVMVEFYRWSGSEFPEEYALIYTSLDDSSKTSTLRLSVNRDKVLYRLADNLFKDHSVRFRVKLTAEKDSNGDYQFGKVIVVANSENESPLDSAEFSHHPDGRGHFYEVKSTRDSPNVENLKETCWEIWHSCEIKFATLLQSLVRVQCDKVAGLSVVFLGPMKGQLHITLSTTMKIHRGRVVLGEPPKEFIRSAESRFEGKEYILFELGRGNLSGGIQAKGLINNIGGHTQADAM